MNSLLELKGKNWDIQPNMHFSFKSSGLIWSEGNLSLEKYLIYWKEKIDTLSQVKRKDFNRVFDRLKEDKLISSEDQNKLHDKFFKIKRQTLNICPGISMLFVWSKAIAMDLDKKGQFNDSVKAKIKEVGAVLKIDVDKKIS